MSKKHVARMVAVILPAVSTAQAVADDLYTVETRASDSSLAIYSDSCGDTMSFSFTGSTGATGQDLCFTVMVVDQQGGLCCSTQLCVTIPDCTPVGAPSDLDGDGTVGMVDFLALLAAWGACSDCGTPQACPADFDGDCSVGILDLLVLLGQWG